MSKRILDCYASDFAKMSAAQLKQSMKAGEGRTICAEMVVVHQPVGMTISDPEVARAFGADIMLLNAFDCFNPIVRGAECEGNVIEYVKKLTGRPIGINLEPVDVTAEMLESRIEIPLGRIASVETFKKSQELGIDFICLTGNPGTGVTNKEICNKIKLAKEHFSGLIIAGKMHGAGVDESVASIESTREFIDAGADIILVPAVGTVPGFTDDQLIEVVKFAHKNDALVMSAIGTSQESSSKSVIENIAIRNKVAGVDIQHIGDAGYGGLAIVENIYAMSVAIRGMRHTINRMSTSINR